MCDHEHDPDEFKEGACYQFFVQLPNGLYLRSTPMLGMEAQALMEAMKAVLPRGYQLGFTILEPHVAQRLLERDAEALIQKAQTAETHLVPQHKGFAHDADHDRKTAEMLLLQAEFLKGASS